MILSNHDELDYSCDFEFCHSGKPMELGKSTKFES